MKFFLEPKSRTASQREVKNAKGLKLPFKRICPLKKADSVRRNDMEIWKNDKHYLEENLRKFNTNPKTQMKKASQWPPPPTHFWFRSLGAMLAGVAAERATLRGFFFFFFFFSFGVVSTKRVWSWRWSLVVTGLDWIWLGLNGNKRLRWLK